VISLAIQSKRAWRSRGAHSQPTNKARDFKEYEGVCGGMSGGGGFCNLILFIVFINRIEIAWNLIFDKMRILSVP